MNEIEKIKRENESITSEFLDILRIRKVANNTLVNYNVALKRINAHLETVSMSHRELNISHIYAYLETFTEYSANTRNAHLSCLYSFYSYMCEINARTDIPISKNMRARIERSEIDYLTPEEQQLYFSYLKQHTRQDQLFGAKIMLYGGLRISEVMNLDIVKDIEIRENKAYIKVRKSKSRKERVCPIFNYEFTEIIKNYQSLYFKLGQYKLNLGRNAYLYINKKFKEEHDIHVYPHKLRYTFATERAIEGHTIDIIRRLLGHQFYTTTLMYIVENQQQIYNLI